MQEIIKTNKCGICVDPFNIKAISEAIVYLLTHADEAQQMGINGRKIVEKMYK